MKSFTFIVHNIYHMGGTTKSISNLANVLSEKGHKVKIISVFKAASNPYFNLNKQIEIIPVIEYKRSIKGIQNVVMNRINKYTSFIRPKVINKYEPGFHQFSSYIEKKLIKAIKRVDTDILIGTRASYNLLVAEFAPRNILKVGMEHMYLHAHEEAYQDDLIQGYENLDIVTTLTSEDQLDYQQELKHTPVIIVPNILKEHKYSMPKENLIVAAGRFEHEKGFDLLIESINNIQQTMRDLDYKLHLYGSGQEKNQYLKQINEYNIEDIVEIKETTNELSKVLSTSKITAVPSRVEGFGLVILEAMLQQSVVIGFHDCYGPEFLIDNEVNGYLIDKNDIISFSNRLTHIMQNYEDSNIQNIINHAEQKVKEFDENIIYTQFIKDIKEIK